MSMFNRNLLTVLMLLIIVSFVLTVPARADVVSDGSNRRVEGRVIDGETRAPIVGATVKIKDAPSGDVTDSAGYFRLPEITAKRITLIVSHVGYETKRVEAAPTASEARTSEILVLLKQKTTLLKDITVTPGRFAIMGEEPATRQTLTRHEISTIPQITEDIYRAVRRLPGISSSEYSAKFTVRGGEHDQILVLMDGLEIYEPFHLKDVDGGVLSIVDVSAIEGIELITGGFSAEYGDKMSGVFNIRSRTPRPGNRRYSVGLSLLNARAMTEGTFRDGRGYWLLSARRGYFDIVYPLSGRDEEIDPVYWDTFAKVGYRLNGKYWLTAHILHANDHFEYKDENAREAKSSYGNSYGWLNLTSYLSDRVLARTQLSAGRVTQSRAGLGYIFSVSRADFSVRDERAFNVFGLKQDWNFEISDRYFLKAGFDLKTETARYDYYKEQPVWPSDLFHRKYVATEVDFDPSGRKAGVYLSNRVQVADPIALEIGGRYDHNSATGDNLFSPRLDVLYGLGEQTFIRAGWGKFYQSQGINEVSVQDGETEFYHAQLAEHYVASIEHRFTDGTQLRVEGYYKDLSHLHPVYRNWLDQVDLFPEVLEDRLKLNFAGAVSKGIEVYFKRDVGGKIGWWASYALASVRENIRSAEVQGVVRPLDTKVPGRYDQRHTIYIDANYRPNRNWQFNVAWQFHTGWPYTERNLVVDSTVAGTIYNVGIDELGGARYPDFHRLDVRLSRYFHMSSGRVTVFLELINLYNRKNIRTYSYEFDCETYNYCVLKWDEEYWLRLIPSVGINWSHDL
jgi:outer membrane cobalamin receptor